MPTSLLDIFRFQLGEIEKDETAEANFMNIKTTPPDTGEDRLPMVEFWMLASALVVLLEAFIVMKKRGKKAAK